MLDIFQKNKVLILGYGREGKDTLQFLRDRFPKKEIGIADLVERQVKDSNLKLFFGKNYLRALDQYDVIIKSPGIPFSLLRGYKNKLITSQTDIFFHLCKGKIIGVTGTKGKSTTCTAIYNALKDKKEAYLLGNIGKPALQYLNRTGVFIYELSSFQLQTVRKSPQIAVILNIFKDHLDQHKSFYEYLEAKARITKFQTKEDKLIYNSKQSAIKKIAAASKAEKIPFDPTNHITGSAIYIEPIIKILNLFDIPQEKALKYAKNSLNLSHRLEFVGSFRGIDFYNDSAATIPEATVAAIENLDNIDTLIVGGVDKGGDYQSLITKINQSGIKNLIIFPETGNKIKKGIIEKKIFPANSMQEAVQKSFEVTAKGKKCLLSPASSSFNMFLNYQDRGEKFKSIIKKYGSK